MKYIPLMAFVALFSSSAAAEDCRIYPPGRARFACASAQHPGLVARREHCKQEAQSMSVNSKRGTQGLAFSGLCDVLHAARALGFLRAEDYYQHYAVDNADTEAVDYHMNMSRRNRQLDTNEIFNERKRYAGGLSSHPLIGRPEKIVDELLWLNAAGIDGVTLSFVNFKDELPFFIERVLPMQDELEAGAVDHLGDLGNVSPVRPPPLRHFGNGDAAVGVEGKQAELELV
jgi:hypothetical protein